MSSVITSIFGGGAAKDAEKAQKLQREQQAVQQARQLSTQNSETARTALLRGQPRGRRLLADASASALPSTVA